ncbi:serine threonine- kinase pim-2-like protein [Labeo rohita]|uniref:Serine/threonine-protein kinase n=1 Tax=Labeo rohita TaxID=84645 RepID=A0A498ND60_LABRO|nr:serine threonine- kinase pim-2-like protein [Labeo rohita]
MTIYGQNVPDTNPAVPEPASVQDLPNCEPTKESLYSLYELQGVLGRGSFGTVYKAIRKTDGRQFAIKRMCKWNNTRSIQIPGYSKPLPREVALMLMLRRPPVSPYVIQMYEWFDRRMVMLLVLEFPHPCMVLRKFISTSSGLTELIARGLMRQLVLAVQHCIDHGVFHNDIHADNILVNTRTLGLKLIDFGAAHLVNSAGYDSWRYLGAVEFCPPEALSAPKYYAVPTNVWSLGVVLYLMVNRWLPFSNSMQTLEGSINSFKSTVSTECRDLIGRCLNRIPEKRPTFTQILQHQWFQSEN